IRDFHVTGVQTCALPICQRALGEPLRWLRLGILAARIRASHAVALLHRRQALAIAVVLLLVGVLVGLVVHVTPAVFRDYLAAGRSEERRVGKGCRSSGLW